jgi:hypothetical protein
MKTFERIRLWWKFEGRYYHKDFINGVKNLIRWFPTIWKDRDWDDHFIWELMIKKITFQAKYIGDRDFHTRAKRDAEIMMTCVRLMEKVKDEYYSAEYMDYHETEYNFVECDTPGYKRLETTELSERFDEYFRKYRSTMRKVVANPKVFDYIEEDYKDKKSTLAMIIARENHSKARRILFTLMERNIEGWWD